MLEFSLICIKLSLIKKTTTFLFQSYSNYLKHLPYLICIPSKNFIKIRNLLLFKKFLRYIPVIST